MSSLPPLLERRQLPLAALGLLVSGVFQRWASAPDSLWWLELFCFVPAFYVLTRLEGWRALLAGWFVGISANIAIFWWLIHTVQTFGGMSKPLAMAVLLLYSVVFGGYFAMFGYGARRIRAAAGPWWPVALSAWLVALEYLNPQLFPYMQGVTWYELTRVFLVTSLTGVSGVSFLIFLSNALLLVALEQRGMSPVLKRNAAVLAGAFAVSILWSTFQLGRIDAAEAEAPSSKVALVQPNQGVKALWAARKKDKNFLLNDFVDLSREVEAEHPDVEVYIWPEGAIRSEPKSRRNRRLLRFIREADAEVWTGTVISQGPKGKRTRHGAAYRISADLEVSEPYLKTVLLPYGEFMPLKGIFPILGRIKGVGNYTPGTGPKVFDTPHGSFSYVVCYEAIRPRFVRRAMQLGADLLVNGTYEGWFGEGHCQRQHLMLAAVQSASHGVPMVRSATVGVSAFIDARGHITQDAPEWERTWLVGDAKRYVVPTPYTALGDWFAWLMLWGSFGLLYRGSVRPESRWDRLAHVPLVLFVASTPWAWVTVGETPPLEWVVWISVALVVVAIPLRAWKR